MITVTVFHKDETRQNYRVGTLGDAYAMVDKYRYDDSGDLRYVAIIHCLRGGHKEVECVMPFEYGVAREPIRIDSIVWYIVKSAKNKKRIECRVDDIDLATGRVEIRAVRGRRAVNPRKVCYHDIIMQEEK